jgi:hypothetical protein
MKMGQTESVPKYWHIKFRHWQIIQKKKYNRYIYDSLIFDVVSSSSKD